jgi:hypothetical protein
MFSSLHLNHKQVDIWKRLLSDISQISGGNGIREVHEKPHFAQLVPPSDFRPSTTHEL